MDFRLSVDQEGATTVVSAAGKLAAHNIRDLESTVRGVVGPVVLDLSNLFSADDAGIAELRLLIGGGIQFRGVLPYMALLLGSD